MQIEENSDCDSKALPLRKISHVSNHAKSKIWFKKMAGLRKENIWGFFCSDWSKDYVKHQLAKHHKRRKEPNDETHKDTVCYLLWSDGNCIKTRTLSASWPVISKLVTLAVCRRDIQEQKKGETRIMVRVRIELTAFALSAPRSAHWANGPDKIVKNAEAWYHADGGGYFPPQKAEEDNTLHYLHKFYKYSRFQYFFYYSFKTFPSSHSFYKNFRQQNICLFLDCCRADVFSAKRLILSLCYINVASVNPVSIFYFYYRRRS